MKKLKVLHIFYHYLSPTENWAFHLISNLPECEIMIGSLNFFKTDFHDKRHEHIRFPFQLPLPPMAVHARKRLERVNNLMFGLYARYLAAKCRDVDIIHAHFGTVASQYLELKKYTNVPYVVSFYGSDYLKPQKTDGNWNQRYQELFQAADACITEGPTGKELLHSVGCPMSKIHVCELGIITDNIPFFRRTKRSSHLKLLQIATFREKKGHLYTIKAFIEAFKTCPNMTLTLVGGDIASYKAKLLREIDISPLDEKIKIIDFIDYKMLHEFMQDYHVMIHPSCTTENGDCEGGAPVILLDAQKTGMPIISTHHCDIPSEVIDGSTGILSEERNVSQITAAIDKFYQMNQAEYDTFSSAAELHIRKNFDIKANALKLRAIYDDLEKR